MDSTKTDQFKAILVDPNLLGPLPPVSENADQFRCWAGYELMMHRLFMAFYPFDVLGKEDAQLFYEAYQALQDGLNPLYSYMGLRYFELGLEFFLRRGIHVVFMFDEFEEMLRQMPVKFFLTLRGLRDSHKTNLTFLTFTRAPLHALVDRFDIPRLEIEPFIELFTDNVYYVGPYNDEDARRMVDNLAKRNQRTYPPESVDLLLNATGRYAGILRSAFRILDTLPIESGEQSDLVDQLAKRRTIRMECQTIWTSLLPVEQQVLKAAARLVPFESTPENEEAVAMLVQKRLLRVDRQQQSLTIAPPVFSAYIATNPDVEL